MSKLALHPVQGGWMIADGGRVGGMWLPGVYDTKDTARLAVTLTDSALAEVIAEHPDVVTRADLEQAMHLEVP